MLGGVQRDIPNKKRKKKVAGADYSEKQSHIHEGEGREHGSTLRLSSPAHSDKPAISTKSGQDLSDKQLQRLVLCITCTPGDFMNIQYIYCVILWSKMKTSRRMDGPAC